MEPLPPTTEKALNRFIKEADKKTLSPNDWARFYRFIRTCHRYQVKVNLIHLKGILLLSGFPPPVSQDLVYIYEHGRALLKMKA